MDAILEEFAQKFRTQELALIEQGRWLISLRPGQMTLGAMVLSDTRGASSFSEIEPESGVDLLRAMAQFEHVAKDFFGAEKTNVICLMMKDPVVHFHLLPRYSTELIRYDRTWRDEWWPGPPVFGGPDSDIEVLERICNDVRSFLSKDRRADGS